MMMNSLASTLVVVLYSRVVCISNIMATTYSISTRVLKRVVVGDLPQSLHE